MLICLPGTRSLSALNEEKVIVALPEASKPQASVQLYTLAEAFTADMGGSLDKLAAIGLKNVEAFDFVRRPQEIRRALDAAGLSSPTGHAPLAL